MTTATSLALITVASSLVGSGLLTGWLTQRMTRRTNADTEQLKHKLDHGSYVTKAQYDVEMAATREIHKLVSEVRMTMAQVRVFTGLTIAGQTEAGRMELLNNSLNALLQAYKPFVSEVEYQRPFYSEQLYVSLVACRDSACAELVDVQLDLGDMFKSPWYDRGTVNRLAFDNSYNKIVLLIRERLAEVRVIP